MAASIALNSSAVNMGVADDTAPKGLRKFAGGLLSRVKKVGENLRNIKMTKEDVVFGAASIGAGLLAKTAAVAAVGVASGGSAILLAAAGGAAMGLVKAALKHGREGKNIGSFFSRTTLMSTVSSTAISVATLGYSGLFECATGQTLTHALGEVFQKAADKLFHLAPFGNAFAAAPDINPDPVPEHLKGVVPTSEPAILPDGTQADFMEEEDVGEPDVEPALQPANHMPPAPLRTIAVPSETPEVKPDSGVVIGENKNIDDATRAKALASVAEGKSLDKPSSVPPSTATPQELTKQAISNAHLAVTQEELTNHYTMERLRELTKATTGIDAPPNATAEDLAKDLAKQYNLSNAESFLRGIEQQAPQIKAGNLAASCTVDIPKEKSSVNVIKTLCNKFKDHMEGNSIVIVENPAEPDPKGRLRLLYRKAVAVVSGGSLNQSTEAFIGENIAGPGGVVQEMAEASLGL